MNAKALISALRTIRDSHPGYDPESDTLSAGLVFKLVDEELIYLVHKADVRYYRLTAMGWKALENKR